MIVILNLTDFYENFKQKMSYMRWRIGENPDFILMCASGPQMRAERAAGKGVRDATPGKILILGTFLPIPSQITINSQFPV